MPGYYSKHSGFVLAVAVNKYTFISLNTPFVGDLVRVKYSKSEMVEDVAELQHTDGSGLGSVAVSLAPPP